MSRFFLAAEQVELSHHVVPPVFLQKVHHSAHRNEHLPAVVGKSVQGAAFDQAFHSTPVDFGAAGAGAEFVEGFIFPSRAAFLDDVKYRAFT